jgi:futalosine hydrolase
MTKILIVAATSFEIAGLVSYLNVHFEVKEGKFTKDDLSVDVLVTGVGMVYTTYYLTAMFTEGYSYDLVINAGLCGSFDTSIELGSVVNICKDRFADIGVTEQDGNFVSAFELKFMDENADPYTDGWIENKSGSGDFLPAKSSITVNNVSGTAAGISLFKNKYAADMESMEGAACAFVCEKFHQKYLQIRSVSNYIEPRNRASWKVELALDNLNEVLISMISAYTR